jgi:NADPH:quinone reductase-like Zn-dependent oxidoreductase
VPAWSDRAAKSLEADPELRYAVADNFKLALKVAAEGKMKALINKIFPLSEAKHAHEIVEGRSGIGKVVLIPETAM